jgi:hypothetical protein
MSLARVSAKRMTRRSKGSSTSQYADSLIVGYRACTDSARTRRRHLHEDEEVRLPAAGVGRTTA